MRSKRNAQPDPTWGSSLATGMRRQVKKRVANVSHRKFRNCTTSPGARSDRKNSSSLPSAVYV